MSRNLICARDDVRIYELLAFGDEERLEAMLALYAQFFPDYAHYVPRMQRRAKYPGDKKPGHLTHYWLFEHEGHPIGLTTFRYIVERECGLGVSFAIDTKARSVRVGEQRLSAFVIGQIMEQLKKDAAQSNTGLYGLVTEVEHRRLMEHYKKIGMVELPMEYFEPVFPPEKPGEDLQSRIDKINFIPVILAITPNKNFELSSALLKNFAEAFLVDHYELPKYHPMVQKTLSSIDEQVEEEEVSYEHARKKG